MYSEEDIDFFNLQPQDEYIGTEDIKPLEVNGRKVYLEQNELGTKSEYTLDGVTVNYVNEKVMSLVKDFLANPSNDKKGQLLLDCSCPRVTAENNIMQKADAMQKLCKNSFQVDTVVVTFSGSGICVKFPSCKKWNKDAIVSSKPLQKKADPSKAKVFSDSVVLGGFAEWPNSLIGTLLEFIDEFCGLEMPVMIFGYTKMCRGISFRSSRRVPT